MKILCEIKNHILLRRIVAASNILGYNVSYLIIGFVLLFMGRWDSFRYPLTLNPDEAQMAANTLRISQYGLNWDSVDGTTSGPLNSLMLYWPYLLNLDVTLSTVRLTASCLLGIIIASIYFSVQKINNRTAAIVVTIPLFVLFSTTDHYDFLHYSSELLPLSLVAVSSYYFFKLLKDYPNSDIKTPVLILIGFCLGAVPFAKLQVALIAISLAAMIFTILYLNEDKYRYKKLTIFMIAGMTPATLFLLPLAYSGNLEHFYNSYLLWATLYIKKSLDWYQLYKLTMNISIYKLTVLLLLVCGLASLVVYISTNTRPDRYKVIAWICSLILLIIAIYSVMRPGNNFHHYLLLILPFLALNIGVLYQPLKNLTNGRGIRIFFYILLFTISMAFLEKAKDNIVSKISRTASAADFNVGLTFTSPKVLSWLGLEKNEKLLIWGWMPQYYLLAGMTPATRETHTYAQIVDSDLMKYFKSRFLRDFTESDPDIILDVVSRSSFKFQEPDTQGIRSFPELNNLIQDKFTVVTNTTATENCPKLYIRNTRLQNFMLHNIPISKLTVSSTYNSPINDFSAQKLTDNSYFEESCSDYWLLPDGQTGNVHIDFKAQYPIRKLLILNTRNGRNLDRATKDVKISIKNKGIVIHETSLHMKPYPTWTIYKPEDVIKGDSIDINISSYYGKGAGLNEIKILQ